MKRYEAQNIIKDVFENSFEKEKYSYFIRNLLKNLHPSEFLRTGYNIPRAFTDFIASYERLGKYEDEEGNLLDVLIVKLKREHSIDYARSTQRNFIRWYLNDKGKDAALVAFHTVKSKEWRFSFIKMQYSLEKKKDELTPAKRSSFMVGESGKSHTAQGQLVDLLKDDHAHNLSDIEDAFSIETVSDEFYEKYKTLVFNLVEEIEEIVKQDKNAREEFKNKNISILNFSKKLLGQIVFLYFLQKKGWLGLGKKNAYGEGDKSFLRNLYNKTKMGENFYNDYLEYLFYDALSQKRVTDFYERFKTRIPFLNGGLFDPIGFYDWEKTDITIPNTTFSNRKDDDEGTGILDIFDLYNFTVKEDEPLETEVAIDPEMLGKVFERMLDVKERKSKGAFYTPREIVHYMAQQSLLYFLETELNKTISYNKLGDEQTDYIGNEGKVGQLDLVTESKVCSVPKEDLETFIHYGEQIIDKDIAIEEGKLKQAQQIPDCIRNNADAIDKALENIKICDPAVGSGAFPVGIMNEIVKLRTLLTPFLKNIKAQKRSAYQFKSNAIQNSIYGVDIDAGAVEIAKLRLWLSLVVDEDRIDTIEPLPNLEYKIVKGNSLINMPVETLRDKVLEREIERLIKNYYTITDKTKKYEQKGIIDKKIQLLLKSASEYAGYEIDFDFKLFFHEVWNEKQGFDVVIGNPPYISFYSKQATHISQDLMHYYLNNYDFIKKTKGKPRIGTIMLFLEKGYRLLKDKGYLGFIIDLNIFEHAAINIRKFISERMDIKIIVYGLSDFVGVGSGQGIIIAQKRKPRSKVLLYDGFEDKKPKEGNQLEWIKDKDCKWHAINPLSNLLKKIQNNHQKLEDLCEVITGVAVNATQEGKAAFILQEAKENTFPLLEGSKGVPQAYSFPNPTAYLRYDRDLEKKLNDKFDERYFKEKGSHQRPFNIRKKEEYDRAKIFLRQSDVKFTATYSEDLLFGNYSLFTLYHKQNNKILLKYILAIINSKVLSFYGRQKDIILVKKGKTPQIRSGQRGPEGIRQLPIPAASEKEQTEIAKLAELMLNLQKEAQEMTNNTDKHARLKTEIEKLDDKIDRTIYKLYDLTDEEIATIEK